MLKLHLIVCVLTAGLMSSSGMASGETFPNKHVRIVTNQAGGGNDVISRLITQQVARSGSLGQQMIVDNRPGASGAIAADNVAKAAPDGHTLLVYSNNFWTLPLMKSVPYDVVRDFSPVTLVTRAPNVLVVHPSLPVNTVHDLIALAKSKPGELNYATGGYGASPHLAAELFKMMASVDIMHVLYKSGATALQDLVAGQVQLSFYTAQGSASHVKAGRLRAIAVTSAQPSPLFPGLPTVADSGLPGFEMSSMVGVWAPAKTRLAVIGRLNQEIVKAIKSEDAKAKASNMAIEIVGNSPEEFAAIMKSDMTRMAKVIKNAGIRAD